MLLKISDDTIFYQLGSFRLKSEKKNFTEVLQWLEAKPDPLRTLRSPYAVICHLWTVVRWGGGASV